jgi:hypothetical protein
MAQSNAHAQIWSPAAERKDFEFSLYFPHCSLDYWICFGSVIIISGLFLYNTIFPVIVTFLPV